MPPSRNDEALALLDDAIRWLTGEQVSVDQALRKYVAACETLGWREAADATWLELEGYQDQTVPAYRQISGLLKWVPAFDLGVYDRVQAMSRYTVAGGQGEIPADEPANRYVKMPVSEIARWASSANPTYMEETGEPSRELSERGRNYRFVQVLQVPSASFQTVLDRIERRVYRAAVVARTTLRVGSGVEGLWERHRHHLDEPLARLGMTEHLEVIERGIGLGTSAGRRSAMYGCRTLLEAVANALWLDDRPTYEPLPGRGAGGYLDVSPGRTKNRLAAYLHVHQSNSHVRQHIQAEIEHLHAVVARVYDFANEAHDSEVDQSDAESVVLGTYLVLTEVARRTGLVPLNRY